MTVFKFRVISTQTWNNNNTQVLTQHKTREAAEKALLRTQKKGSGNILHVEEIK